MITFQIVLVKRKPFWLAITFIVPFAFFDGKLISCSRFIQDTNAFKISRIIRGSGVKENTAQRLGSVHDWCYLVCFKALFPPLFSSDYFEFHHRCVTMTFWTWAKVSAL